MRRFLATVATWVGTAIAAAWLLSEVVLDLIGYSTSPEDAAGLPGKAVAVLNWIDSQPWLLAYGIPALLIGFGALTLWPHPPAPVAPPALPPQPIIVEPPRPQITHKLVETGRPHQELNGVWHHTWEVQVTSPFTPHMLTITASHVGLNNLWGQSGGMTSYKREELDNPPRLRIIWSNPPKQFTLHATTKYESPAPKLTFEFG